MGKLDREARMTINHLRSRGLSQSAIARLLGVTEGAVRYHAQRQRDSAIDGRTRQVHLASEWDSHITTWLESLQKDDPINLEWKPAPAKDLMRTGNVCTTVVI